MQKLFFCPCGQILRIIMHSYVSIHHFEPKTDYQPIENLIPFINQTMEEQQVSLHLTTEETEEFRENIIRCLEVYYQLVGIDDEVIASKGAIEPQGILPRYTESLISFVPPSWSMPMK